MKKVLRKTLTVVLSLAMVMTMIPSSVFASSIDSYGVDLEWYNFRNNQENNAVTDRPTPIDVRETWMKYGVKYGNSWAAASTPPLILDGNLYTARGKTVMKLDKETGELLAESDPMAGTVDYAMNPILYADGKLFVQVGNGVIQALDYKTLKCLWHTKKIGGQTISPISYTKGEDGKGYIYTGTWTKEDRDGTFFCVSTDDENVVNGVKQHIWDFVPKRDDEILKQDETLNGRGFYWAGAYANENYVAIGTDDGTGEGDYTPSAVFYTLNPTTGEIIDRIDHIKGDVRSTVVFDDGFLYFNTKGGILYKVPVDANGKINNEMVQSVDLGGMTTATPLVYKNKIYLGVAGNGAQFNPDGGHRFAVIDKETLKELYNLPIKGYPQAGALLSTAHENEDYDGDGNPDGRVYLYFTYNAPPGGIYYTYDTPDRMEAAKEQGEIFVPNKEDQQHCISTIIADRKGTLYYKNDSCKIFAVEINPAYLTDIKIKASNSNAMISPAVNPQIRDYRAVIMPSDKATIELELPEGVTAKIDGKSYNGKAMEINLSEDLTTVKIETIKDGMNRIYTVNVEKQRENPYLKKLFVNGSNSHGTGVVNVTPELNTTDLKYVADITDAKANLSGFYNIWMAPTDPESKIEVRALSNFKPEKHADADNPETPLLTGKLDPSGTGLTRYPLYFQDLNKSAEVEIKVTTVTGKTERIYKLTLFKKEEIKEYTVTYDANAADAKGEMADQTFIYGKEQKLSKNQFTRDGYVFAGWKDNLGNLYTDEQMVTDLASSPEDNIILYAVWEKEDEHNSIKLPEGKHRFYGPNRYATAFKAADALKEEMGVDKFQNIVVATGSDYPDALSGSYLAKVKNAPVLLVDNRQPKTTLDYIKTNLEAKGTVYLLGGEGVISGSIGNDMKKQGYNVVRLGGKDRYKTNLNILKEAGVKNEDLLVCTGNGFADSLSASAAERPVLLVGKTLTAEQKAYLAGNEFRNVYLIGGAGVVNNSYMTVMKPYSTTGIVERVSGVNRYATSVAVAEKFFNNPENIVFAYALDFPDGLSGGTVAMAFNAPMLLVDNSNKTDAMKYAAKLNIKRTVTLGGPTLITNDTVDSIAK